MTASRSRSTDPLTFWAVTASPSRMGALSAWTFGANGNCTSVFASAPAMLRAWQGSPGHRRNLLDGDYTAVGIARAQGDGGWYWTTVFGDAADRAVGC